MYLSSTYAHRLFAARSSWLAFRSKNTAVHIFGLNDEEAIGRDEEVFDLGGAVSGRDEDVVEAVIGICIQFPP